MTAVAAGLGTVAAVAMATVAARHAKPAEVSPVTPNGHWNAVWIWSIVAALVLSVGGWVIARRSDVRLGAALAVAIAVQAIPLGAPLLLSKDTYAYWAEARIVTVHHANPYVATPADYPNDPAFPTTSESWRPYPAPYGPVWETLATLPALAARASAHDAELGYRILAVLGVLAAVAVVAVRTRSAAAVALLGWSPLLALHYAGGGHSDAWMIALLVFAVATIGSVRSGAVWALSSAFKPIPVILLPLELTAHRLRMKRRWWIGLAVTGTVVAAAATAAFGLHWFTGATQGVHQGSPLGGVHWLTELGVRHRYAVAVGALAFAGVYLALLREAWLRGRARLSLAATALCLTSSLLRPWYGLWPLALAAIELDTLASAAALGLSAYLLLGDAVAF